MTPKEKAEELFYKFKNKFNWIEKDYDVDLYRDAKQCALIAVDEILDLNLGLSNCDDNNWAIEKFYTEVKQEIDKL